MPPALSTKNFKILVVDDHAKSRESVADILACSGYQVQTKASATEALPLLRTELFDVIVTDLQMPGMDGLEFIRRIEKMKLGTQILMMTAYASVSTAVEALQLGAFDYIEKPFDLTQLEGAIKKACQRRLITRQTSNKISRSAQIKGKNEQDQNNILSPMIGSSLAMQQLRKQIKQVANTDETVLICGESGTGKELVANAIHSLSSRVSKPLVSLNCPVLSTQLTESELFGHEKGAFTGADSLRIGRFEMANNGSLLLDEITEIDLQLQAKLLRVLQERRFERVGASDSIQINVRMMATTNRDLLAEIKAGRFRDDLYYRLAVVPLQIPALRQRENDVIELADHFLDQAAERLQQPRASLTAATRELLLAYHWPGNVRELENIITRACVLNSEPTISAELIRPWLRLEQPTSSHNHHQESEPIILGMNSAPPLPVGMSLQEIERQMILATLEEFNGHREKTAKTLGIGVRTLSGKLKSYGYAPREKNFRKAA